MKDHMPVEILHQAKNQRGSALLGALFCTMLLGFAAAAMYKLFGQELHTNRLIEQRLKAQEVATGAAARALAFAAADVNNLVAPPAELTGGTLGEGYYTVEIEPLGDAYFMVHATGHVGSKSASVKVYTRSPYDPRAFRQAVFSNGEVIMSGGGNVKTNLESGSHSNKSTDISGRSQVGGDAVSVDTTTVKGKAKVLGSIISGSSRIKFPSLDFDHYYNIARTNGEVHLGDVNLQGTYTPNGGVMWVVGDVHISSHTTINGALFATGSVHQAGSCDIYQVETLPAIVSRDGNIFLSGQSKTMSGLIFAASGQVDVTGKHGITGSIIAWGDVMLRGSWGMIDFRADKPELDADDRLEILAWEM